MRDEFWATFSIHDHRTDLYRQALLLFDRIVVPIPTRPCSSLSQEEIDGLAAEVEFLEQRGAAKLIEWDPDEFAEWRTAAGQEAGQQQALAKQLVGDPPFLTRLQLKEKTAQQAALGLPSGVTSITAVPLFGSRVAYEADSAQLKPYIQERLSIEVVFPRLPVPGPKSSFDDILHLRSTPSFKASLEALRRWQKQTLAEVLLENSPGAMEKAAADFDKFVREYADALADARYTKVTTAITSVVAVGAALVDPTASLVAAIAAMVAPSFSLKTLMRPCWKDLEEKRCFPAGVVYEASRLS